MGTLIQWQRGARKQNGDIRKQFLQWTVPAADRRQFDLRDGSKYVTTVHLGAYSSKPTSYVMTSGGEIRLSKTTAERLRSAAIVKPNAEIIFRIYHTEESAAVTLKLGAARNKRTDECAFDPRNDTDARARTAASIVRRQGQPRFRKKLLKAYDNRCAISRCDCIEALEAAHIRPYKGGHTNHVQNGILLRSDLHTLMDLGKIYIDPNHKVAVCTELQSTVYKQFHNKKLHLPTKQKDWPDCSG